MGIPVVIATNGRGIPVRAVEKNAPVMEISPNGFGQPIVLSDLGAPYIVRGAGPGPQPTFWRTPWTATTRIVTNGHSLVDDLHDEYYPGPAIGLRNSLFDPDDWGDTYLVKATIPGSSTDYRWNAGLAPRNNAASFDCLVITERGLDNYGVAPPDPDSPAYGSFKGDIQGMLNYALNQIDNGGDNEFVLYSIWPAYNGDNGPFLPTLDDYTRRFKWRADYLAWKCKQLRPGLDPNWRVPIIPGNQMVRRLYDDLQLGLIPGITSLEQIFDTLDGGGADVIHMGLFGGYAIACLFTTVGYQVDLRTKSGVHIPAGITQAQADYVWRVAYEIASTYEPCGMGGSVGGAAVFNPATDVDPLAPVVEPEPENLPTDFALLIDGDDYTGPAFSPALPVPSGGMRKFTGAVPLADMTMTGYYAAMAIRSADWATAGNGQMIFASKDKTSWDMPYNLATHIGGGGMFALVHHSAGGNEGANGGTIPSGEWGYVEVWMFGSSAGAKVNAGADVTTALTAPVEATGGIRLFNDMQGDLAYMGVLKRMPTAGERIAIRQKMAATVAKVSTDPLKRFYDSGTISAAYDAEHFTVSGGNITEMANKAQVNGVTNYLPVGGNVAAAAPYASISATGGYLKASEYIEFIGNRVMWVMDLAAAPVNGNRIFGKDEGSGKFEVYFHVNATPAMTIYVVANTGTAVTIPIANTNRVPAVAGKYLFELEATSSEFRLYINGVLRGTGAHSFPLFHTNRIGIGTTGNRMNMRLGGPAVVATGRADTDAAIAAVRADFNTRYALGLTL